MKTIHFLRILFAGLLIVVAWVSISSQALAHNKGTTGNDISWPQCGTKWLPQNSFEVVGVNGGRAFTKNPCFANEIAWAKALAIPVSLYMNLNSPIGSTASEGMTGPYGNCKGSDTPCQAANYGYNAAQFAYTYAQQQGASARHWWLDIEIANSWFAHTTFNQGTINGATRFFTENRIKLGVYSTPYMWMSITGGYRNHLPVWFATVDTSPAPYCSSRYSFTTGKIYLVQYANPNVRVDSDYTC